MNPYDREVAHLRQVISTAKIVVTLTGGLAVTFVAAELQGTRSDGWEQVGFAVLSGVVAALGLLRP